MLPHLCWKVGQVLSALAVMCGVGAVSALAQSNGIEAFIQTGNCETPGTIVAPLNLATVPAGAVRGNQEALPAANSYTAISLALDVFLASDHAIVIGDMGDDEWQGCGVIGGPLTDAGALILGISPLGTSGLGGVAFLSPGPGPGETGFSLFLSDNSLDRGEDSGTSVDAPSVTAITEPTATIAASEQSAGPTSEEVAYIRSVNPILAQMVESLDRFMPLYGNPRFDDENWKVSFVSEIVLWKQLHKQLSEIVPPESMANLHSQTVGAFSLYAAAGTDIINAVDNRDPSLIDAATVKLARATDSFLDVKEQYDAYRDELAP